MGGAQKRHLVQRVSFDANKRHEFVHGMRKRKMARRKQAEQRLVEQHKESLREKRRELRASRAALLKDRNDADGMELGAACDTKHMHKRRSLEESLRQFRAESDDDSDSDDDGSDGSTDGVFRSEEGVVTISQNPLNDPTEEQRAFAGVTSADVKWFKKENELAQKSQKQLKQALSTAASALAARKQKQARKKQKSRGKAAGKTRLRKPRRAH